MVVHNGIITNYREIKEYLMKKGHKFEVCCIVFTHNSYVKATNFLVCGRSYYILEVNFRTLLTNYCFD